MQLKIACTHLLTSAARSNTDKCRNAFSGACRVNSTNYCMLLHAVAPQTNDKKPLLAVNSSDYYILCNAHARVKAAAKRCRLPSMRIFDNENHKWKSFHGWQKYIAVIERRKKKLPKPENCSAAGVSAPTRLALELPPWVTTSPGSDLENLNIPQHSS